jgi:ABC-type multidrug transport system fused ATPase/permease subunit
VSYKYPTSQTSRPAVKDLTCTFGAGKIIVIVGANGSGKTSLVKLLAQLHFPSSGDILIDGVPAGSYRRQDLRHAIAILSQDHHLFPFSIRENIAVGRPYGEASQVQIQRAARMGGAHEFISRFTDDYETTLTPLDTKVRYGLSGTQPLRKVYDEVEKETKISGTL